MCTCATHCTLSPHHDIWCCGNSICNCWCHGEIKLFLDDERPTPDGWFRVHTVHQTILWLNSKRVTHLSVDNDLGENEEEGYRVLDWLEETIYHNEKFPIPEVTVHSDNAGRLGYMKQAINSIERMKAERSTKKI